uniref:tRNA selenocysteine-associated protein 1 n=1 Tax=Knipowitschia caucasica TaxID=637954 RepID=A0AAV2JW13_KNICA
MMFNRQTSLWMGDLDQYMDEDFLKQAFSAMGESPLGVKIITHRITGGSAGYCFVELADEESVERCVQRLNGKLVPGSNPPRKFKLNYATYGKRPEPGPEFSVFVGDLASEVDDYQLHQAFKKYPSCKGAKVVTDQYGYSRLSKSNSQIKGYGFVKFGDENEQKKVIEECQGMVLVGKQLRLSIAVAKSQKVVTYQGQSTYPNYSPTQTSYYGSTGGTGAYYPQWGSYDQYSGYGTGYNTGYNTGYGTGYSYNYGPYGYPPPGHMIPPPPVSGPSSAPTDTTAATDQSQETTNPVVTESTEDPLSVCDVDQRNKDFMQQSEELYEALMNCHWEPLNSMDSSVPSC